MNWIGRSEYAHHRTVEGNGKMHRTGIVGHAYRRSLHNGRELGRSGLARKIDRATTELRNLLAAPPIAFPSQDHYAKTLFSKPLPDFRESLWMPVLRLPKGTGNQCTELLQPILFEEPLRGRLNLAGQIDSGVDCGIVQAEYRC